MTPTLWLFWGLISLAIRRTSAENELEQLHGIDVDKITLMDDLSKYPECGSYALPDSAIMQVCKNNSICRLVNGPEGYMQVFCDCSNTITETHYYMGPQCETISGFLNTSWLEDLLSLNAWKNDFSRVGPLI